jgi:carboxypeptidase Q
MAFGIVLAGLAKGLVASPLRDVSTPKYLDVAEKIRREGLTSEKAYAFLERLTKAAGLRLTGSPQAAAAVELTRAMMAETGFETWLEPVTVQHWVRGVETADIVSPPGAEIQSLAITALGWSVPTPAGGITADVVEVGSFDELAGRAEKIKNRIVFFNHPMDRTLMDTFRAYGEAAQFRTRGAAEAAKFGAAAVLIRSATFRTDRNPHAGMVQYDPVVSRIPAAAVATADADALSRLLQRGTPVSVHLNLDCQTLADVKSSNVVGQIRGTEHPDEIVLLGGHLDSWDLAVGAHDDGSGCVQAMEALRLIKSVSSAPKRTVRVVLFMNEEFGATGGRDYAADVRRKKERHLAAIESDRGGFLPIGFGISGSPDQFARLKILEDLLRPSGIQWVRAGGGGADIGPLGAQGAVLMSFIPNAQTYFDVHHSGLDMLSSVHPRELELGAIVMAIAAYVTAQEGT